MERTKTIGEKIKEWRKEKRLTQRELATMCDTTQEYISRVETGRHQPSYIFLLKVSEYLGLDIEEPQTVGEKIRRARIQKGLTQGELSALCDMRLDRISKIETGKHQPSYIFLLKVSEYLGLDIEEPQTLGEKIRQARVKKGLTQRDLAEICFSDQSWISDIELGKQRPQLKSLRKICQCLGLDFTELSKSR